MSNHHNWLSSFIDLLYAKLSVIAGVATTGAWFIFGPHIGNIIDAVINWVLHTGLSALSGVVVALAVFWAQRKFKKWWPDEKQKEK